MVDESDFEGILKGAEFHLFDFLAVDIDWE
jgi:hypothetical protein